MADTTKGQKSNGKEEQPQAKPQQFVREKGRGIVKSVPSGDTIVVLHMDRTTQGPPVERQITLSSLQAPTLARRKTDKKEATQDEPFAWQSREFLRKKCIGKQVQYTVEFKNPTSKREYGTVQLTSPSGDAEDLSSLVVGQGWAKVKRPNNAPKDGQYRPELQQLIDLEEEAKRQGKGLWTRDQDAIDNAVRQSTDTPVATLYDQLKGKAQTGIVEQVRTGSSLRITLSSTTNEVPIYLSGVQAPDVKSDGEFEPFGREAKFFTEHHLLNRDVQVILEGVDKFNLYASVSYSNRNIAEELLKNGLGRYVEWSGSRTAFSEKLKAAEKEAKEKKLRIWSQPQQPQQSQAQDANKPGSRQEEKKQAKPGKEITGKVVEVVNGGTVIVVDNSGQDYRINLSSIKVSKQAAPLPKGSDDKEKQQQQQQQQQQQGKDKKENVNREAVERAYAWEAKEFLRRRLIGQRVRCVFDYSRDQPPQQQGGAQKKESKETDRLFFSVYIEKNNIAVELAEAGLAQALPHKGGEQRSRDYETILLAEERAKKLARGIWQPPNKAPVFYVNDISQMEVSKQRQFLPYLKRSGKIRGFVEFEFSASRVKIFIPKDHQQLIFSLAAVRTPMKTEPFSRESLTFTRDAVHQHDVEFEVMSQDRGGAFVGNLWVNKKNLATLLLEEGFASLHGPSLKENEHSTEYIIAEESAKRAKKHIWKDYDEQAELAKQRKREEEASERKKSSQEFIDVVVTEVIDGNRFYVQIVGADLESLEELMKNLSVETSDEPYKPRIGELVKAQFVDDAWYRAKVTGTTPDGEYSVLYIDYGNTDAVPTSRIRPLDSSYTELPPQAHECQLAYIKTPSLSDDYGEEAAVFLRDSIYGKTMMANVEYRDGPKLFLSLGDRESQTHVGAALLRAGLARVERVRGRNVQSLIEKLKEEEAKARSSHSCIWEYGDPGSDDEDEPRGPAVKQAPAKPKGK